MEGRTSVPPTDEAEFTFSWLALKLLGKGLYSNPWSALSELVANGLDASAEDVYVYVDARVKSSALVEVMDNGSGMSRDDISTYVKVGFDKRKHAASLGAPTDTKPKGRKGIGKLAALFLSSHFYLETRHLEGTSSWELDARDGMVSDDLNPKLLAVDALPVTANDGLWAGLSSGTRLVMLGVDLTGYGPQAINALGARLANQFLLPSNTAPRILLCVQTGGSNADLVFAPVEKSTAFGNFSDVAQNFSGQAVEPADLADGPRKVLLPAKGLPGDTYEHTSTRASFHLEPQSDVAWAEIEDDVDLETKTYRGVPFSLTGWIGVHSTIDNTIAQRNDSRFTKNRYYNPAQIRVYVRGKLANDHLLSQLGLTGTYTNYIEGEVTFDLLDEDSLPDIATANRQDFDETDKRVTLLRALVRPVVRGLIARRNTLASEVSTQLRLVKERRESASKQQFSEQLQQDLDQQKDIPASTRDELHMVITNKIQGDITPKQIFRVFISHARGDKPFASLIDDVLQVRGARQDEIFYSSRTGSTRVLLDDSSLSEVIKRNITSDNTLIFYMTSKNFLASEFCLFEGGAGWATRAVSEYLKLNIDYESIPKFLTNGKGEATLMIDGSIELTPGLHNYLIEGIFNPMIEHLNRGRVISSDTLIELFPLAVFPPPVELDRLGRTVADYFDPTIVEHWDVLVVADLQDYLRSYQGDAKKSKAKRKKKQKKQQPELPVTEVGDIGT